VNHFYQHLLEPFETLCSSICKRPGMYVGSANFDSVCAYLDGYDHAQSGASLRGFREWLVVRRDGGNNLVWWGLVLGELDEDRMSRKGKYSKEEHEALIEGLGQLLAEFFAHRREVGLEGILYRYSQWLLSQSWYEPLRSLTSDSETRAETDFERTIPLRLRKKLRRGQFDSGSDIQQLRRFVGLNQVDFAKAMGVSVRTLRSGSATSESRRRRRCACSGSRCDIRRCSGRTSSRLLEPGAAQTIGGAFGVR